MEGRKFGRGGFRILAMTVAGLALAGGGFAARAEGLSNASVEMPQMGPVLAAVPAVLPTVAPAVGPAAIAPMPVTPVAPVAGKTDAATPATPATPVVAGAATGEVTPAEPVAKAVEPPVIKEIEGASIRPSASEGVPAEGGATKKAVTGSMSALTSTLQVAGALAVVLGIVLIGRTLMKRFVPGAAVGNGKGVMETLARYSIGRNQSVVLLRIGSQIVALNQTKDASQSILVINEPMEVAKIIGQIAGADANSIQTNFNRALSNARMDLETPTEMASEMPDAMDVMDANRVAGGEDDLDQQLEEMAAAKRQLMELRAQVRSVRDNLPA